MRSPHCLPTNALSSTRKSSAQGMHRVGKVFFANYQNLDEELDGKKLYEHYEPDFFDLVVVDECHRSGFGDWFGVLEHFGSAYQLGLTATPRELDQDGRPLTDEELRRDTYEYFRQSRLSSTRSVRPSRTATWFPTCWKSGSRMLTRTASPDRMAGTTRRTTSSATSGCPIAPS